MKNHESRENMIHIHYKSVISYHILGNNVHIDNDNHEYFVSLLGWQYALNYSDYLSLVVKHHQLLQLGSQRQEIEETDSHPDTLGSGYQNLLDL